MQERYYSLIKSEKEADLYIFGDITSYTWKEKDKDAYGIVKELEELDADTVNVHINSYGGDVSEGLAIHNTLKNKDIKVVTYCDGFACSAASVVFMAGDERIMNDASLLMIHNPWTWASGNAKEFRKQADDLDKIAQASVNAYMSRVNISEEKLKELLDDETWITAQEAVDYGFATQIQGKEEEGISQSAMMAIRKRILNHTGTLENERVGTDVGEIAKAVAKEIVPILEKEKKEECTNWGAFFNTKKGE